MSAADSLDWDEDTELLGVRVQVRFLDPGGVPATAGFAERALPVFAGAMPRLIGREDRRSVYSVGELWAQPDAVFEHGDGLLCLTWRPASTTSVGREQWQGGLRADAMLQTIVTAMVVAGARQAPTAALHRLGDALFLYSPSSPVLECLATSVDAARRHWSATQRLSAVQLACYCEPVLRSLPGVRVPARPAPMAVSHD